MSAIKRISDRVARAAGVSRMIQLAHGSASANPNDGDAMIDVDHALSLLTDELDDLHSEAAAIARLGCCLKEEAATQ